MDSRALVVYLEKPLHEYSAAQVSAKEVVLAGLSWPTDYWPTLAVSWLEQGVPLDAEIVRVLENIAEKKNFPQKLRHKAFALSRQWSRENGAA
ncbi:hypothetical protein P5X66_20545 [Enterobacter hormaechei]|uniref:hypothetical protein n=1 Tax=Enterobacter hormaechei TaxID=158836 RepID=UPI0023F87820|nr:hypothetical protein [Enterobacter hormaechei]MDF9166563.1 hypothetical protein [Enterobacter hormaechei]WES36969.1 hypothetical protein P3J69_00245 [Enterobacter hormaechei]